MLHIFHFSIVRILILAVIAVVLFARHGRWPWGDGPPNGGNGPKAA
jgi:hypothetical protein